MVYKLPEWHYHSITCHVPCATVPLTSVAYAAYLGTCNPVYHTAHLALSAVSFVSLFVVFATGFLERESRYTNWTFVFKAKTALALLLFGGLCYQLAALLTGGVAAKIHGPVYGVVVIGFQALFIAAETWLGITTAQGRIGGKVSYRSDPEFSLSFDIIKTVKASQPNPLEEEPYDRF